MPKIAIIFASYIPQISTLPIGEEFFHIIKNTFPEAPIFVGINPSPCLEEWVNIVKKYTPYFEITPDYLIISSDTSAYQSGLRLYKEYISDFDYIIFIHTKGISTGSNLRRPYTFYLLESFQEIYNIFQKNPFLGAYTFNLVPLGRQSTPTHLANILNQYFSFPYSTLEWLPMCSNYIIKGNIVNTFIQNCNNSFLSSKLVSDQMSDGERYFFERDFIHITDKQGYGLSSYTIGNTYERIFPELTQRTVYSFYKQETINWISKNNLSFLDAFIKYYEQMEKP